ncbi:MAG: 50S ribosomal protein L9 [Alphaproteobacteria bacterium]
MKVVLLERIEKLGRMGDVVSVKDGFGRNYLLPQKKALRATAENIAYFENQRAALEEKSKDLQTQAEGLAKKIEKVKLLVIRQASEAGQLYGSVTSRDIAKYLAEKSISITHAQVRIDTPVKTVGVYDIKLALHPEVSTFVKISVAPSEEEAKKLLETPEAIFKKDASSDQAPSTLEIVDSNDDADAQGNKE